MKRTRKRPPYNANGRTNFPRRFTPGVYLITPEGSDKPVYVGMGGADVYKPLYRHFQTWNEQGRDRVTYAKRGYLVRVIYTHTETQAQNLERALILKHQPRDNANKYDTFTLTDDLKKLAQDAESAGWMPTGEDAPF
jgi:excinuclease UvrABC nuclease subunit